MEGAIFIIICIVTVTVAFIFLLVTRGILSEGTNSDAQKQIRAAAMFKQWKWFSDMHKYAGGKAWLRDVGVIGIAIFQRLLNDYKTFFPVITMCTVANSFTAVMIYLVSSYYWNIPVGLLIFALYMSSFWSYQVVLQGGFHVLGTMFLLISVHLLQLANLASHNLIYYFLSGICLGLMIFSSASSRKLLPLFFAAFFYSQRHLLHPIWFISSGFISLLLIVVLIMLLSLIFISLFFERIVTFMYKKQLPSWIAESFMSAKDKIALDTYLSRKKVFLKIISKILTILMLYFGLSSIFFCSFSFYLSQLSILGGLLTVFIVLTYPEIRKNLDGFYTYWTISKWGGHFRCYKEYFAQRGKPLREDYRGAGIKWYFPFFWRMLPFHYVFYLLSILAIIFLLIFDKAKKVTLSQATMVIFTSLLPIFYSEFSGAVQLARTYFPTFLGLLIPIAYSIFSLDKIIASDYKLAFWTFLISGVILSAIWNLRIFITDILPAKMAPARLRNLLKTRHIKKFYTYDIPYNNSFLFILQPEDLRQFQIIFIKRIKDVKEGLIIIPPTSSKSNAMESEEYAIKYGDFVEDPILNYLLDSKKIMKYSLASFKTIGTSRIWSQEGEVPSYRDLILKEINDYDRWRGYAWILDAKKLSEDLANKKI